MKTFKFHNKNTKITISIVSDSEDTAKAEIADFFKYHGVKALTLQKPKNDETKRNS